MSIHKFPEGGRIEEDDIDHSKDVHSIERLSSYNWPHDGVPLVSTPDEFDSNLYMSHIKHVLSDPRLKEMPENVLNIRNGTLVKSHVTMPELGIEKDNYFSLFYDGMGVRLGSLDSAVVWPVETIIRCINDKKFENCGSFLEEKSS